MKKLLFILFILASWLYPYGGFARIVVSDKAPKTLQPVEKFYIGSAFDGAIFSTADIQKTMPGGVTASSTGTPRFTLFFNLGATFHYNPSRHIGFYTGVDLKNIGFIETNNSGATVKRRTYNIGIPVALKIGNMVVRKPYLFVGGGLDFPINYKEKTFEIRDQKAKLSEWFSGRTPALMPYVFAGASVYKGLSIKFQYYSGNFLNPDYTANGAKPYLGYNVHLLLCSVGYAIALSRQTDEPPLPPLSRL